jgi:hypothetical protein
MNVQTLSAAKLLAAIEVADKKCREVNDAFIDCGRGYEKMQEIRKSSEHGFDPLARSYCNALDTASVLNAEKQARLQYRGNLKPIKRAA